MLEREAVWPRAGRVKIEPKREQEPDTPLNKTVLIRTVQNYTKINSVGDICVILSSTADRVYIITHVG